jgi:hypothetical protein
MMRIKLKGDATKMDPELRSILGFLTPSVANIASRLIWQFEE